jgi:hypothetical protein
MEAVNPARRAKRKAMETFGFKSGKQYRKYLKKERLKRKEVERVEGLNKPKVEVQTETEPY